MGLRITFGVGPQPAARIMVKGGRLSPDGTVAQFDELAFLTADGKSFYRLVPASTATMLRRGELTVTGGFRIADWEESPERAQASWARFVAGTP